MFASDYLQNVILIIQYCVFIKKIIHASKIISDFNKRLYELRKFKY